LRNRKIITQILVDETPRKAIIVDGPENEEKFLRLNVGGSQFCFRRDTLINKNEGLFRIFAKKIAFQVF
jgi:hypothetical protein